MTALLTVDEAAALRVGVNVIVRPGDYGGLKMNAIQEPYYVAPQAWTELTGRIVPLYRRCIMEWWPGYLCDGWITDKQGDRSGKCDRCDTGRVLVGWGSIEVGPVMDCVGAFAEFADYKPQPCVLAHANPYGVPPKLLRDGRLISLALDPLPVPGRDFGIVIDVTELA